MVVLSSIFFACLGIVAIAAIVASLRRYMPLVSELRQSLRQSPDTVELRLRVADFAVIPVATRTRRRRRLPGQKPVRHRLHGRGARRAIA